MADATDMTVPLSELDNVLNAGMTSFETDGNRASVDLAQLSRQRRDIAQQDSVRKVNRPRVARIDLSQGP